MTDSKPGRPPLNPGEPLTKIVRVPVTPQMLAALRRYAGDRSMAAVVREFIAAGLQRKD